MYNFVFSDVAFQLTPSNRLFHFDSDGNFILDQPLDFEDTPVHRLSVKAFNGVVGLYALSLRRQIVKGGYASLQHAP